MAFATSNDQINQWNTSDTSKVRRYEYSPIGFRKIRLVELRREEFLQGLDVRSMITITFLEVALDSPPEYEALSYVWGDAHPDEPPKQLVRCEKRVDFLPITANLHIALEHLCPRTNDSKRLMWIDALCINQESIDEKNAQLLLMPEIYRMAQSVHVWLGPEENESDLACNFLEGLNTFSRTEDGYKFVPGCQAVANEAARQTATWRTKQSGITVKRGFSLTPWLALGYLLRRAWFRRVWVIQEVLLGRKVFVTCGMHKMPWEDLVHVVTRINPLWQQLTAAEVQFEELVRPFGMFHVGQMADWRKRMQEGHIYSLEDSILLTMESQATDSRDMIWAVRGVTKPDDHPSLIPDYGRSVKEVFTSTARHIICDGSDLDFVCIAACQKRDLDGVPSWVPIFGGGYERFVLFLLAYAASGTAATVSCSNADPTILSAKGKIFDVVETVGTPRPSLRNATPEILRTLHDPPCNRAWVSEALNLVGDRDVYVTGEPMFDAFWRTLIVNRFGGTLAAPRVYEAYYSHWLQSLNLDRGRGRGFYEKTLDQIWRFRSLDSKAWFSAIGFFTDPFYKFGSGRKFGVTRNGYIGLLPAQAEARDIVVVLDGAKVPLMLRKTTGASEPSLPSEGIARDEYTVIGDCYVHGIMQGEFTGKCAESRVFALR